MISVICPVFNEEKFIGPLIEFFLKSSPADKELILIDGNSTDQTVEIIEHYQKNYSNILLLRNPERYVPYALNMALRVIKGEYIIRLDAHTDYDPDYFEKVIESFQKSGAEIVGGPMRPTGGKAFQQAVAWCTSTKFGVGDSQFHDDTKAGYVDSVYLGAWKKDIFYVTGGFDEQMMRNQDDEFHYRAKSRGFKIYLNPEIKSWYYPRDTVKKLFKQYFQYGLFKPLVIKKVNSETKIRHLIPSVFTLYLLSFWIGFFYPIWFIPGIIYLLLDVYFSLKNPGKLRSKLNCLIIYPVLHISYGTGFLLGLNKKNIPNTSMPLESAN